MGARFDRLGGLEQLGGLRDALREREIREREVERKRREEEARRAREASVFQREVAGASPLKPTGRVDFRRPSAEPVPRQRELDESAVLAESISDEIDIERLLDTDEQLSFRRPGVGPDVTRRLRRGEWSVGAQIDLHGLRVEEAREALGAFLAQAAKSEIRCVRIIHGKGLGSVGREPVLKGKVLKWLVQREQVIAFCQARPNDGGSGALIALLQVSRRAGSAPARPAR